MDNLTNSEFEEIRHGFCEACKGQRFMTETGCHEICSGFKEEVKNMRKESILDQIFQCSACNWEGTLYDCEPDVDGDGSPGCPECGLVANMKKGGGK